MEILKFTIRGDYARFRVPYTTTSALTYSTITPIAARGIIGAIMGIEYSDIFEYSRDLEIGIKVKNEVRKTTQSFNLKPMTNSNGAANYQSRIEFLRDVEYEIYVKSSKEKLKSIYDKIESCDFIFTPYLGCSEYNAIIRNPNICIGTENNEVVVESISVIPKKLLETLGDVEKAYFDRIPIDNTKIREYSEYEKVVFTINQKLKVRNHDNIIKVGEEYVYFF